MCFMSQTPIRRVRKDIDKSNSVGEFVLGPRGNAMKKAIALFFLLDLFCVMDAVLVSAQEKSYITVRGSELNNGVVILDVRKANKDYRLQCNQGAPGCTTLKNGNYQMMELPKNFGMYECRDIEVYPESAATPDAAAPDKGQKLGEYCLVEK